jgi:hypothetical protein
MIIVYPRAAKGNGAGGPTRWWGPPGWTAPTNGLTT